MAILDLFEDRVRENPYDIYIQSDNISYTFKKVDNSSNYIATVVDNSSFEIIPIYIKNDILVIPTILGILKSGKIPLPISTDLEFKIAKEQIKDIKYDVLLTDVSDISETILISKNIFDEDWYFSRKQQNNKGCYIVSTSGTTGVPKKVLINEDSLIAVLQTYKNITNYGAIPIGKPIDGVEIRFDEVNIDGKISFELWIGGSTLSNGYCDSSLNFDKFVEFDKLRYYKTGDIVEYDEKGQIFYKGRKEIYKWRTNWL